MKNKFLDAVPPALIITALGIGMISLTSAWAQKSSGSGQTLRGEGSFNDWDNEKPGNRYLIKAAELPKPYATESATNQSKVVPRPADAWPQVPEGFKIDLAASGLESPRTIVSAPNGDLFLAESNPGRIRVIRGFGSDGKVQTNEVFATGLTMPYGIAFYPPGPNPQYVYIGNTNSVVRFPYKNGDLKASGPSEIVVPSIPGGGKYGGGHWTRSLVFSNDGKKLYVGVGSQENVGEDESEKNAPTCSNSILMDLASESTRRAFETRLGSQCTPRPANFGLPSTSGTRWAMIWYRITFRTSWTVVSTAGRGITRARIRTRGLPASTPN